MSIKVNVISSVASVSCQNLALFMRKIIMEKNKKNMPNPIFLNDKQIQPQIVSPKEWLLRHAGRRQVTDV